MLPPGDIRRCLVALSDDETWSNAFEYRFTAGDLEGHALGNLMLVGLTDMTGDFTAALDAAGRLLRTVGRVLPATTEPVVLKAEVGGIAVDGLEVAGFEVEGQVAVQNSTDIRRVDLVPADAGAPPDAVRAIEEADQVVLAPGSLYTSLLPVLCVDSLRGADRHDPRAGRAGGESPPAATRDDRPRRHRPSPRGARAWRPRRRVRVPRGGCARGDDEQIRAWDVVPVRAKWPRSVATLTTPRQLAQALHALL